MKNQTRISGALLLVVVSLLAASLACYSGQIPGVFELTPYYTETPLPTPVSARFQVGDFALTSQETQALFNLTTYPEPLQRSLLNSKDMCLPNVAARVLYAGLGDDGIVYYLVECGGSAGWAADHRLAGPVELAEGDLALTVASEGQSQIQMLDKATNFQPIMFPTCAPGTIVPILSIEAMDVDDDGIKDVFYYTDCGTGTAAFLTAENLEGPLELRVGERALAIPAPDAPDDAYRLASEPAPVTDENAVEGDCPVESILEAQEIRLIGDTIYYRMTCGEIEGWTTQDNFVGPLRYDVDDHVIIFMPPVLVFADELPSAAEDIEVEAADVEDELEAEIEEAPPAEDLAQPPDAEEEREVVEYTPPLYLTDRPVEPVLEGEDANVVGQCASGSVATIHQFAGVERVYYRVTCDECVATEENVDGERVCSQVETRDGWAPQEYLQGPLEYAPGDRARLTDTGASEEDGPPMARVPEHPTYIVGANTRLAGRCPVDEDVEITAVRAEKDRTRNAFSFYYQVQCQGDAATAEGFNIGGGDTVIGWASERSLEPVESE